MGLAGGQPLCFEAGGQSGDPTEGIEAGRLGNALLGAILMVAGTGCGVPQPESGAGMIVAAEGVGGEQMAEGVGGGTVSTLEVEGDGAVVGGQTPVGMARG